MKALFMLIDAGTPSPPWKQQARERVLAELQALGQREEERVARGQLARERRAARALASTRCVAPVRRALSSSCSEHRPIGSRFQGVQGNVW